MTSQRTKEDEEWMGFLDWLSGKQALQVSRMTTEERIFLLMNRLDKARFLPKEVARAIIAVSDGQSTFTIKPYRGIGNLPNNDHHRQRSIRRWARYLSKRIHEGDWSSIETKIDAVLTSHECPWSWCPRNETCPNYGTPSWAYGGCR
jgi:hypothetical protein